MDEISASNQRSVRKDVVRKIIPLVATGAFKAYPKKAKAAKRLSIKK